MLAAPTSAAVVLDVTMTSSPPEPPSLSVTLTCTVYVPGVPYPWLPVTAVWVVLVPLSLVPSPQLIVYDHGASFAPGSLQVAFRAYIWAGKTVTSGPASTTGGRLPIVAVVVTAVPARPLASVTVRETVYAPSAAYVRLGETPVPADPSPKSQAYVSGTLLSGADDAAPLKATTLSEVYGPPGLATGG